MTTWEIPNGLAYSPPAEHRTYAPPTEPEPFPAPRVSASAVKVDGTVLEQAFGTLVHARNEHQKHFDRTNEDRRMYSDQGFREQMARFKDTAAARAVDTVVDQVRSRRDEAQSHLVKVRRDLSPAGDAAQESRALRFWARTKAVLDASQTKENTARQLINEATRDEIGVLLEELPSYFTAQGSNADWIDPLLAQVVPEYGAARAKLVKANAAVQFTEAAAEALKRGFDNAVPLSADLLERFNPHTAGRIAIDRRGTLPETNGGRYDPDR